MNKLLTTSIALATLISSSFASQDLQPQNVEYFNTSSNHVFIIDSPNQVEIKEGSVSDEALRNYQSLLGELKTIDKEGDLKIFENQLKKKILQDIKGYNFGFDFTVTLDMNELLLNTLEIQTECIKILKDLKNSLQTNKCEEVNSQKQISEWRKNTVYQLLTQYLVSSSKIEDIMNGTFKVSMNYGVLEMVKAELEYEIAENIGDQICLYDISYKMLRNLIKNKMQYKRTLKNLIISQKNSTTQKQTPNVTKTESTNELDTVD